MNAQRFHTLLAALFVAAATLTPLSAQTISTLAGDGTQSYSGDGSTPTSARLNLPSAVWGDTTGVLYIADTGNSRIRRISVNRDTITTYAGSGTAGFSGDAAAATSATINAPAGVFVDSVGVLYIADTGNHRVRSITAAGIISTIAGKDSSGFSGDGGLATTAKLNAPTAVFARGGFVYIADTGNNRIRRISSAGIISTIAGKDTTAGLFLDDTTATVATLKAPRGLYVDRSNNVYIADTDHHRIRKLTATDSTLTTLAGNGSPGFSGDGDLPTNARLAFPTSVVVDTFGTVYIADRFNHRIRRVNPSGNITTIAGRGSVAFSGDAAAANRAELASPSGLYLSADTLFFADQGNQRLRKILPDDSIGLSGALKRSPGKEAKLLSLSLKGDGATTVNGLSFTVSDLPTVTGLSAADFVEFRLYESSDTTLGGDTQIGRLAAEDFTPGTQATIAATTFPTPAADVTRYYLLSALLSKTAIQGHALRVGTATGALSTDQGGRGSHIHADSSNKLTIDVVATKLVFQTQPGSGLSGSALRVQPIVAAVDDSGYVDFDFADTVTVSSTGTGTLLQSSTIADSGRATFANLSYSTSVDDEAVVLRAKNIADNLYTLLDSAVSDTFKINVFNDPPVVNFPALVLKEDEAIGFRTPISSIISDEDDSTFTITFSSQHILASVSGDSIIILPEADFFGIDTLTVTATDAFGLSHSDSGIIEVTASNDTPVLALASSLSFAEDETLSVDMQTVVSDVDNDFADLQWTFTPSTGLSRRYTSATGVLQLWADANVNGDFSLTARVQDPAETFDSKTVNIAVAAKNDAPQMALRDTSLLQGTSIVLDLAAASSDVDDDPAGLSWAFLADSLIGVAIDSSGLATIAPAASFSGVRHLVFSVSDTSAATGSDTLQLTVLRVNQTPTLSGLPDTLIAPGDTLHIDLAQYGSDPDDDIASLIWSISGNTRLESQLASTALSLIAPASTDTFSEQISVRVFDLLGFSAQDTFLVKIEPPHPPIAAVPDLRFEAGRLLAFDLSPYLSRDITSLIAGANDSLQIVINASEQSLTLSASEGFKGKTRLVLQAGNARGEASRDTIEVEVTNPAPTLIGFPEIFLDAGFSAQLPLDAYARDDEALSLLSWSAVPAPGLQVSIHGTLHIATISAGPELSGLQHIAFSATDAQGGIATDTLRISVHGDAIDTTVSDTTDSLGNSAPRISAITTQRFHRGTFPRIQLDRFVEDDGPLSQLEWSARAVPPDLVAISIDSARIATISALQDTGVGQIIFAVIDADSLSSSLALEVEVRPPLSEPEAGDFDRDGRVDFADFFLFVDALGLTPLHPDWDPVFDLNNDGQITLDDFFAFADAFSTFNRQI